MPPGRPAKPVSSSDTKQTVTVRIDPSVAFSIKVHSLDTGTPVSEIVERLIRNGVPCYSVSADKSTVLRTK